MMSTEFAQRLSTEEQTVGNLSQEFVGISAGALARAVEETGPAHLPCDWRCADPKLHIPRTHQAP